MDLLPEATIFSGKKYVGHEGVTVWLKKWAPDSARISAKLGTPISWGGLSFAFHNVSVVVAINGRHWQSGNKL